jgi:2'-hydroxyisoflavone reductase
MKLLILGGTQFLGRHITDAALHAGHEVTLFNRGRTNPHLFGGVEVLKGDRDGRLDVLAGRRWDAVIDTCGYIPRHVGASARLLAEVVEHYTFISSISVYADDPPIQPGMDEGGALRTLDDETVEEVTGATYGGLKVLCERAAEAAMPGRVLHVRSGLIVGPYDPTDRFTYWPVRVQLGGEVLAPGSPDRAVQFIDARDQAAWILKMAAARKAGTYNVTGPAERLTMRSLLEACRTVSGAAAEFTWVEDSFLLEHNVGPFMEMPLWIPDTYNGLQEISVARALADGLTFRPLAETIRDTLAWNAARSGAEGDAKPRAGMMRDREAELLAAWKSRP